MWVKIFAEELVKFTTKKLQFEPESGAKILLLDRSFSPLRLLRCLDRSVHPVGPSGPDGSDWIKPSAHTRILGPYVPALRVMQSDLLGIQGWEGTRQEATVRVVHLMIPLFHWDRHTPRPSDDSPLTTTRNRAARIRRGPHLGPQVLWDGCWYNKTSQIKKIQSF